MGKTMTAALLAGALALAGCGQNCADAARMGDFEASQNNFANAAKNYEKALKINPSCGEGSVKTKLEDARKRL
jgi:predicted TPR repeat methyltransferase